MLVVTSSVGLFYYLRLVITMYRRDVVAIPADHAASALSVSGTTVLAVLAALLLWLGVYPAPIVALIQSVFG